MSTFQGFKVTGIDPDQYPVFTDDNDMRYDLFYLTLEPIGTDADHENRRLWDYCFREAIENRNNMEHEHPLPELKFLFDADGSVFISASGEPLRSLQGYLFNIDSLVQEVNKQFIRWINDVKYFRKSIKEINESFRNRVINM